MAPRHRLTSLRLKSSVLRTLDAELAAASATAEVCGLLGGEITGDRAIADRVEPLPNLTAVDHRFAVDATAIVDCRARWADQRIAAVGFYHSHANGAAHPSVNDRHLPRVVGLPCLVVTAGTEGLTIVSIGVSPFEPVAVWKRGGPDATISLPITPHALVVC